MSAIFISYTGRDPEGDAWADWLTEWFQEWNYGYFRDKDHSHGVKAGEEWRPALYRKLGLAQAMVCLCSRQYESSHWCVGEVAIALREGKTVIPLHLVRTAEEVKIQPLPSMLQTRQTIKVTTALNPSPEQLAEAKHRLRERLNETLNWRGLLEWNTNKQPYPGLPAFEEHQAPVFFGRDVVIETVVQRLKSLARSAPGLLMLLGASGYGKSSLVRAGVVPRLKGDRERSWMVLRPFTPKSAPFTRLREALGEAGATVVETAAGVGPEVEEASLQKQLQSLGAGSLVVVIDQFEELLVDGNLEGERFLAFLQRLLSQELVEVVVVATMRTDFLAPLQSRWPELLGLASALPLEPIPLEDYGELICGPAMRAELTLQPGLQERLVSDSKGQDALPLLAFTLEKLWMKRQERDGPVIGPREERWDLTVDDYTALGGVEGAVKNQADLCWNPETGRGDDAAALRDAFLENLVTMNREGKATKRPARLQDLPERSLPIVERMVKQRLLVASGSLDSPERTVEIAHEALLRTWEPLVEWIKDGKEELLQCLRVNRLGEDLKPNAPERQRRQALEQLAALAAAGGSEERAVQKEARETLEHLLIDGSYPLADREDAALVLALIGAEEPLQQLLANGKVPVGLRRRAAESLGLLAQRTTDSDQRHRIKEELERWLRSEPLEVRIEVELDSKELDPVKVQALVEQAQGQLAEALQQAIQSGQLPPDLGEEQLREMFEQAVSQIVAEQLMQQLWAEGRAPGWAAHDAHLPLLQGAARGLQLAASADLRLLGSGPGLVVPMLSLTALNQKDGKTLKVHTKVLETVKVWRLPLPEGQQLEMVLVPGGDYTIGSPKGEPGKQECYDWTPESKSLDKEPLRPVVLEAFAMVRYPITQAQWAAIAGLGSGLRKTPGNFKPEGLWETHAQPGCLPVDSVSWNDCETWLELLNGWLEPHWHSQGLSDQPLQLRLPGEGEWEVACRAGSETPFHFGDTLDSSWTSINGDYTYGLGRKGDYRKRPTQIGATALVNNWGLAEMHGQLYEWCGDQWHPSPLGGPQDGGPWLDPDTSPEAAQKGTHRLLRGGSWLNDPPRCRAASRYCGRPDFGLPFVGVRPCCFLPPGLVLGP